MVEEYILEKYIYIFCLNRHKKSPSGDNRWAGDESQTGGWADRQIGVQMGRVLKTINGGWTGGGKKASGRQNEMANQLWGQWQPQVGGGDWIRCACVQKLKKSIRLMKNVESL